MSLLADWWEWLPSLLRGLLLSLEIAAVSIVTGVVVGMGLALAVSAQNRLLRAVAVVVVEVGRGTPALVVLQLVYFGLPSAGLTLASFAAACLALGLTTAAYTSEILRAGLQAVPQGEVEASQALGMGRRDTLRYVVAPQGVRIAVPALMGFSILIFQGTSLAFTISVTELLSRAYSIGSATFDYLSVIALAGLLYLAVTLPAGWFVRRAERRMARHL